MAQNTQYTRLHMLNEVIDIFSTPSLAANSRHKDVKSATFDVCINSQDIKDISITGICENKQEERQERIMLWYFLTTL